eukprot:scaffold60321_cov58-Phaeocystis_antarctica.AAC.3
MGWGAGCVSEEGRAVAFAARVRWWQGVARVPSPLSRGATRAAAAGAAAPGGDDQGQEERRGPKDVQSLPARAVWPHRGGGHLLPRGRWEGAARRGGAQRAGEAGGAGDAGDVQRRHVRGAVAGGQVPRAG